MRGIKRMANKYEVTHTVRLSRAVWDWCVRYGEKHGDRSGASVIREAIQEKQEREKEDILAYCFDMGYDAEINGATERNCHFSLFSSKEKTKAWEDGKHKAIRESAYTVDMGKQQSPAPEKEEK
jgi:ribosome modulation factor